MDSQKAAVSGLREEVDIVAKDWNNRIRDAVMAISSNIPEVGAVVEFIIGCFWPVNKIDIFQALKADMIKLIKHEILEYELNQRCNEIDALKSTITEYREAKLHEKGVLLEIWISEANKLSIICRQSNNNIHLILPSITVALLHLTGLLEKVKFGKELYQEDNIEKWKHNLEETYKTYIVEFFPDIFKQWKDWRKKQVEITHWTKLQSSYAKVVDNLTGQTYQFAEDSFWSERAFSSICEAHHTQICNDASADMAGCISTTFLFYKLLPDNNRQKFPWYDKDVFGCMLRGPYSDDLFETNGSWGELPVFRTFPDRDDGSNNSGPITKVIIRGWNSIDAMQFIYANREGLFAGNPTGGERYEIDVTGKAISGFRMGFAWRVLVFVQIIYIDGTTSIEYGNHNKWSCKVESAKAPAGYRLSSWGYQVVNGPSDTYGPGVLQFEYEIYMG